jgi:hypothetical protein
LVSGPDLSIGVTTGMYDSWFFVCESVSQVVIFIGIQAPTAGLLEILDHTCLQVEIVLACPLLVGGITEITDII